MHRVLREMKLTTLPRDASERCLARRFCGAPREGFEVLLTENSICSKKRLSRTFFGVVYRLYPATSQTDNREIERCELSLCASCR